MANNIPVYLFTGFLEAGKTKMIQETLEDEGFNDGCRILLLTCEEGIEEYDATRFFGKNVYQVTVEREDALTPALLERLTKEKKPERVVIEYNGMWQLNTLYESLPRSWYIFQQLLFVDATTAITYNANMRSLMVDKLNDAELVIFNRADNADRMALHKLVRGISRRARIAYETAAEELEYDEIEDPLPFNKNAPIIAIADEDYALFYRDLADEMPEYNGKTVKFKGLVARDRALGKRAIVIGRHVMTCCEDDIAYQGVVCNFDREVGLQTGEWAIVTAKIKVEPHKLYGGVGPVLYATDIALTSEPKQPLATFY